MNILLQLASRAAPNHDDKLSSYLHVVISADRRDAELMFGWMNWRLYGGYQGVRGRRMRGVSRWLARRAMAWGIAIP